MLTYTESLQVRYVAASIELEDEAKAQPVNMPLTAKKIQHYARIAYRAAMAERYDPEPVNEPCVVCRGVRVCDWLAHKAVGWHV